ncbi:kinase-like domain-containing protein [Scheffersomyces coipomensis]|uniref:kinase-like domain-containing protein n=1 Tax=Scheffersomyces coipomensis TaxID=1788519 RepID=UPI00315D8978
MSPKSPNLYKKTQIIFDGLSPDEIKKSLKYLYELKKETLLATFHSVLPEERTKNFQDTREFVKNALNNFKSHDSKDLIEHYSLKGPLIPINQSKCTFKAISLDKTQYCIRKIKLKKAQTYQQILSYVKKYWYSVKLDPYYFRVIDNIFVSKLHRNRMIIVSKFIPGENLEIALKTYREFQDINFCLGIFKEIAKIVDSLHIRYGICHGDLRPQNIIYNRKTKRITIIGFKFQFSLYDSYNSPFALGVMRRKCPGYVRKHNETFFKYVSDYRQIGCAEDMFALGHILFNLISSGDMLWTTCHKRDKNFYYYKCYSDGLLRYDEKLLKLLSSRTYPIDQTLSYIRALPTLKKMIKLRDSNRLDFFTLLSSPWFNELQDVCHPNASRFKIEKQIPRVVYKTNYSIKKLHDNLKMVAPVIFVLYGIVFLSWICIIVKRCIAHFLSK